MIKKIYQVPVELHLYCDQCGEEMEFGGMILTSNPPQYPHKCPKCGAEQIADAQYPHIIFERKQIFNDIFQNN